MKQLLIILSLLALVSVNSANAQEAKFSRHSLKVGFGITSSMGDDYSGFGFTRSVGYQHDYFDGRLRFNPNVRVSYLSALPSTGESQYFNIFGIEPRLFFDLFRIKGFSLVIGGGATVNCALGYTEISYGEDEKTHDLDSDYIVEPNGGFYFGAGFRINPQSKRVAVNIMPLNMNTNMSVFEEIYFSVDLDFKF